jgi:hypothetical protein
LGVSIHTSFSSMNSFSLYNTPMPKTHSQYVCQQCGRRVARPMGRYPGCGAWNSMVEEIVARALPQ